MTIQAQRQRAATKRLPKKPRSSAVSTAPFVTTTVTVIFTGKSTFISHSDLRSRTLQSHLGKLHKPPVSWQRSNAHQKHGVELTDDVIIRNRNGRRVPTPAYAALRIDQLPQFRKG